MCELLAMSARYPTTIRLSMDELARHGGGTGPHRDGWGFGFVHDRDALVMREPSAAAHSPWLACLREHGARAATVVAHVRRATQGHLALRNTQPFSRELGGHVHLFAHNGMLPGIEAVAPTRRFQRIGDTDSEQAFCALLDRLAPHWERGVPALEVRLAAIADFAAELRAIGPANFVYSDGDAVFAHAHRRRHDDGEIRAPGLHLLCRTCNAELDGVALAGIELAGDGAQEIALLASVPLSAEPWEPLPEGEVIVLRAGKVVLRAPAGPLTDERPRPR